MSHVLIADDEPGFRDLFVFALEPLGHTVTVVSDGAEAVAQAEMERFDLIVLDHHMPNLTGLQALKQIRALLPNQRVLLVSASADHPDELAAEAMAAGAMRCLFKPLELEQLIDAVRGQL